MLTNIIARQSWNSGEIGFAKDLRSPHAGNIKPTPVKGCGFVRMLEKSEQRGPLGGPVLAERQFLLEGISLHPLPQVSMSLGFKQRQERMNTQPVCEAHPSRSPAPVAAPGTANSGGTSLITKRYFPETSRAMCSTSSMWRIMSWWK